VSYTSDRLLAFLRDSAPLSYCYRCLAENLGVPEHQLRDAALIVTVRPGFDLVRASCGKCGRVDDLLVYRSAGTRTT
jgi:hypothetical protein